MNSDPLAATWIAERSLNTLVYCLDDRRWDDWLACYTADVVYWVPAWRNEDEQTRDPNSEVSQIYHDSRTGLAERVARVRSGKSVTAMPLPRTTHFTSNLSASFESQDTIIARANWMVHSYQVRTAAHTVNFGHYDLTLRHIGNDWRIAAHTIHLKNDLVPALIDFYTL